MRITLWSCSRTARLGVKISIDHFGTPYSSPAYLKGLRVDRLKVDQSFIRDLAFVSNALAIVKTIVQPGRNLNLSIKTEGLEDAFRSCAPCDSLAVKRLKATCSAAPLTGNRSKQFVSRYLSIRMRREHWLSAFRESVVHVRLFTMQFGKC